MHGLADGRGELQVLVGEHALEPLGVEVARGVDVDVEVPSANTDHDEPAFDEYSTT